MRSEWIPPEQLAHALAALTPANQLACVTSLFTGLRIGDVLALRTESLSNKSGRITVREQKTGKTRRVYLPDALRRQLAAQAGRVYIFQHRTKADQHRTRQAVFKDLRRAAKAFRLQAHVSPHSLRKMYAVDYFNRTGDLAKTKALLNHSDEAVTLLYALADRLPKIALDKSRRRH